MAHLTFNLRVTKFCNADCDYCSSWQADASTKLDPGSAVEYLEFIFSEVLPKLRLECTSATVLYVGGEVLAYPAHDFKALTLLVRRFFDSKNVALLDGVQSNFIGSQRRVESLVDLFDGRVGTTDPGQGGLRKVDGSDDRYRRIFDDNFKVIRANPRAGLIYTLSSGDFEPLFESYKKCSDNGNSFVIRPLFEGGRKISRISNEAWKDCLIRLFDVWFMCGSIAIDPLFEMTKSRLNAGSKGCAGCNRQSDCAKRSFNIDPDGALYTCLEMADAGIYRIGDCNARSFSMKTWVDIGRREFEIRRSCGSCPYYASCKGGCLVDSYQSGAGPYSKTPLCSQYKELFQHIDDAISARGVVESRRWLSLLEVPKHAVSDGHNRL